MPTCTPSPASTSVKASHDRATVASLWMTSDVRPPPPTAVRKFPVLNVWMVQVVGVANAAADAGWPSPTTPAAASASPPAAPSTRLRFMHLPLLLRTSAPAPERHPYGVPRR